MNSIPAVASLAIKVFTLILNIAILVLYRVGGTDGDFLGTGGTWDINDYRLPDLEIFSSGIFVGLFIFNAMVLVSYCLGEFNKEKSLTEGSMLIFGAVGFFLIGGIALNYWLQFKVAYNNENLDIRVRGIWLAVLCLIQSLAYSADCAFTAWPVLKAIVDEYY